MNKELFTALKNINKDSTKEQLHTLVDMIAKEDIVDIETVMFLRESILSFKTGKEGQFVLEVVKRLEEFLLSVEKGE